MKNILIADAGSTKTQWSFLTEEAGVKISFLTKGINPAHQNKDLVVSILQEVKERISPNKVDEIYFYGSGCATPLLNRIISSSLSFVFHSEKILVDTDIKGAAIALFGLNDGIACILGTGSASALYSKGNIISQTPSLGYILGDEGGGVALGKHLLNAIFKKQLSNDIINRFQDRFELSLTELIEKVYKEPKPAAFIASFSPFLLENLEEPEIRLIVEKEFENFFIKNLKSYPHRDDLNIGIVGSVAFNYKDTLVSTADKLGYRIHKILKNPMPALEDYYLDKF